MRKTVFMASVYNAFSLFFRVPALQRDAFGQESLQPFLEKKIGFFIGFTFQCILWKEYVVVLLVENSSCLQRCCAVVLALLTWARGPTYDFLARSQQVSVFFFVTGVPRISPLTFSL